MTKKFFPLDEAEKQDLMNLIGLSLPLDYQDLKPCCVMQTEYPFYPGWSFIQIGQKNTQSTPVVSLFYKAEDVVLLDWQASTIMKFNEVAPLSLTIHYIPGYVEFFFRHVRTPESRLQLITAYEDFSWSEEPTSTVKRALSSLLRPPHIVSWDEANKIYEVGAHLLFKQNLFECRLFIDRSGFVEIRDRTLQVEDMPVLDELVE